MSKQSRDSLFAGETSGSSETSSGFSPSDLQVAKALAETLLLEGPKYNVTSLSTLAQRFEAANAKSQFVAWTRHEPALITPQQLEKAFGHEFLASVCERSRLKEEDCLRTLTYVVPKVLEEVAPFELSDSRRAFQFNLRELLNRWK